MYFDAELLVYLCKQTISAAIDIVDGYNFIAGLQQFYYRVDGGEAAAEGNACFAIFQSGHQAFECGARRVVGACIIIPLVYTRCILHEGGGLIDRYRYSA